MSKPKSTMIICICTVLTIVEVMQARGWRGLVPLHSTRADVERLLGTPKKSKGLAATYETKDQRVVVFYSAGDCKQKGSNEWNVPRYTVISITVHPNAELLVDELKLDKLKYERLDDSHVEGVVYYFNKEDGIRISARVLEKGGEDVDSITYEAAARDHDLRCSPSSSQRTEEAAKEYLIRKFDEYSGLSFEDERARLDNFAIYLQKDNPQFRGYIIVYAPKDARSDAKAHADCAKNYLVNVRGIAATRIETIDGGCRDRLEIELYALPSLMSSPTPNPYCND